MRTFANKPKTTRQTSSTAFFKPGQTSSATFFKPGLKFSRQNQDAGTTLHSQRSIDNQVHAKAEHTENSVRADRSRVSHDFGQISAHQNTTSVLQHVDSATSPNKPLMRELKSASGTDDRLVRGGCSGDYVDLGDALRRARIAAVKAVPVKIFSTTRNWPTWKKGGQFVWDVSFSTTGRSGWIIQEITNTWRATNSSGKAIRNPSTPHFYEAWAVDKSGNVTPSSGKANDSWDNLQPQVLWGAVRGVWSTTGKLYFTKTNPATQGFIRNNPATNAKHLLSSITAPAGLNLGTVKLHRFANGVWDSPKNQPHVGTSFEW